MLSLISVAIIGFLAVDYLRARHVELSEVPERRAEGLILEPSISEFTADITVPYDAMSRVVTNAVRNGLKPTGGQERIGCAEVPYIFKECLDFNWTATPSLSRPIIFQGDNDLVRVNLSGSIDGGGGFGGGIAGILSLNRKSFDAAFNASIAAKIRFDANFCPILTPGEVQFSWTKEARVQLIGRSDLPFGLSIGPYNLDFGRHFNGPIRNKLKEAVSGAKIDCQNIRLALSPLWRRYAIPVAFNGAPPLFINIDPASIYVSGIQGVATGVRSIVAIQARIAVDTQRGPEDSKSEPLRNKGPTADITSLALAIPLKISYESLEAKIIEEVGQEPMTIPIGGRSASVMIEAVDVYPASDRLALGIKFSADLPWRIFDTLGTVWITARPVAEEDGTVIYLHDLTVTRQTDSVLWDTLTAGFSGILLKKITEQARYDLSGAFTDAQNELEKALANTATTRGVRLTLSNPRFYLGRIVPEDEKLAVEGGFVTNMEADLSGLTISPN